MDTRDRRLRNTVTLSWLLVVFVGVQFGPSYVKFFNGDQAPIFVVLALMAMFAAFGIYCQRLRGRLRRA
jgi:hypothetical protein